MVDYNGSFDVINNGDCKPYEKKQKNSSLKGRMFG